MLLEKGKITFPMHLSHALLDNLAISLSSTGAFPVLYPAQLWDGAQGLLQQSTDRQWGWDPLIKCSSWAEQRHLCQGFPQLSLKLDTCNLSNLVWPKQPNPRDERNPWYKERESPWLLPSEKSVSCVRVPQCLIMSWSFSATCANC